MRYPFEGSFAQTQNFNDSRFRSSYSKFGLLGHNGEDYGCPAWTPILAPHKGLIKEATFDSGYGNYVKVESDTEGSILAHLSKISVSLNQEVQEGQLIGYSGNTGNSTGAHLHWGYYRTKTRNRDNGFNGYIDQTDWLDHNCPSSQLLLNDQTRIPQIEDKEVQQINAEIKAKDKRIEQLTGDLINSEIKNNRHEKKIADDGETIKRLTDDLEKAVKVARDLEELLLKQQIAENETVEITTKTYPVEPKTTPKPSVTVEWPLVAVSIVNFIRDLFKSRK